MPIRNASILLPVIKPLQARVSAKRWTIEFLGIFKDFVSCFQSLLRSFAANFLNNNTFAVLLQVRVIDVIFGGLAIWEGDGFNFYKMFDFPQVCIYFGNIFNHSN